MDAQSEGRGDSDGTLLSVADDFATKVVLCLTVGSAVEGRQEVQLEELEDVKGRASLSSEQVVDVCGDNQLSLNHFASVKCKHRALATCP
eukprot:721595-Rhodomonas_salina.1